MTKLLMKIITIVMIGLLYTSPVWAQDKSDKPKGRPPSNVFVSKASTGLMAPTAEFIGTVFYPEVSEVASELTGIVEEYRFDEGQRVKKGQILVKLRSDLLEKRLQATVGTYEQALSSLEKERRDLKRVQRLYKGNSVSEQLYDEEKFGVQGLERRAASLMAQVEHLQLEIKKKTIRAPFSGVIIKRHVDRGEWLAEGATIAILAKDDVIDIVTEVPESVVKHVRKDMPVSIKTNGYEFTGNVFAVVPRGDISTRTFPVKIRTQNQLSLIQGMAPKVSLPTGPEEKTVLVPRDAVIPKFGQTVLFAVVDTKAKMIPVQVTGYNGMKTGVKSNALKSGMVVVIKGNERLRDGQAVAVMKRKRTSS
jgi:RND family efflux transporter MFP subunit